jgi:hypothetical protein
VGFVLGLSWRTNVHVAPDFCFKLLDGILGSEASVQGAFHFGLATMGINVGLG